MEPLPLPTGVTSRSLPINDLQMHILEAGNHSAPLIILLHGFPELAISWRKVILPLAEAGYHVVAPDQRGFGRTTERSAATGTVRFEDDLASFRPLSLVRDIIALAFALGYRTVASIVGHDFGSPIAAYCALIRPDVFKCVVLMSAPFPGAPMLPFATAKLGGKAPPAATFLTSPDEQLAALDPPRKHYTTYFSGPAANEDMWHAPQGLHAFLRAYFHVKSADWAGNNPHSLASASAAEFAKLPHYYVMPFDATIAEVVQRDAPSADDVAANTWLDESDLAVYVAEHERTGFQGGLNWYRTMKDSAWMQDLAMFSGKKIEVPSMFLSGKQDWGVFQSPGALDWMRVSVCKRMDEEDFVFVDAAGHWVQQEQAEEVVGQLLRFLDKVHG